MKEPTLYRITRPLIKTLFHILYCPTYIGLENIPMDKPCVLAGNHTNYLDCLLLISSTKRTIHFLAKDDLIKGSKKIIFKNMGIIPVNRKKHDGSSLTLAKQQLQKNKLIGIFPEGTINRTKDTIMPFKIGAVKMTSETNSYLIPFSIKGKYKIFKKGVVLEVYKPYLVTKDLEKENQKLMKKIRLELEKKVKNEPI